MPEKSGSTSHLFGPSDDYKEIFECAGDAIAIHELDGGFLDANRYFCAMVGYSIEEILRMSPADIDAPGFAETVPAHEKELRNKSTLIFESTLKCKDGRIVSVELTSCIINFRGKKAALTVARDISEQKRDKEEFRSLFLRNQAILSAVPDIIMQVDTNKIYTWANQVGMEFFGPDVIGKEAARYFLGDQKTYEIVQPLFDGNENVFYLESWQRRMDGEKRLLAWWCRSLKDEKGDVIGAVSTARDITEQERINAELQKADKLESLGVLAGGIAHDVNNLLTGIFGHLQLARLHVPDASPAVHSLEEATKTFARAKSLTQQLLTFSKGGAPVKKNISIANVLEETARFALSGSNVSAETDLPGDLWMCHADENQMAQVVDNIIINARQAMPLGGKIFISASNCGRTGKVPTLSSNRPYVKVAIKDNGIGIPKEILPRIFDPFFSTKQLGSGLGLATVYSILKKHEGHIEVESEPGKGSTFTFYLPALTQQFEEQTVTVKQGRKTRHEKILLMDDEKGIRDSSKTLLESTGYSVDLAQAGSQAVKMYKKAVDDGKRFNLVILDLTVPGGMGGLEAFRELFKIDPAVKAIATSGYADDPVMAQPRSYGFAESLAKPYLKNDLFECVERALSF